MKYIQLTKGQMAVVDDELYGYLNQFNWQAKWDKHTKSYYASRWPNIKMSREILGLKRGDSRKADHINHNTLDNQCNNLRAVTNSENCHNRKAKGYYWQHKFWRARIRIDGKLLHLGCFTIEEEAKQAYLSAKKKYFPHLFGKKLQDEI